MTPLNVACRKGLGLVWMLALCLPGMMWAQNPNIPICQDEDCPPSLFDIKLTEPLLPDSAEGYSKKRTENFKEAYTAFRDAKQTYALNPSWIQKHRAFQLGGRSSLRHYQLEATFSHEYTQNSDFKQWVDTSDPNAATIVQSGFQNSRQGLNLYNRMKNNCPREVKAADSGKGPTLDDLSDAYQSLGQNLGYFDEEGNVLKPIEDNILEEPEILKKAKKVTKKDQVNQLKEQMAQLPLGTAIDSKMDSLKQADQATEPQLKTLESDLQQLGDRVKELSPKPTSSLAAIETDSTALATMYQEMQDLQGEEIMASLDGLEADRGVLKNEMGMVLRSANQLQEEYDQLTQQQVQLQEALAASNTRTDSLETEYGELKNQQDALNAKLEDKPKKILEELTQEIGDLESASSNLVKEMEAENQKKKALREQISALDAEKEKIAQKLQQQEDEYGKLTQKREKLKEGMKETSDKVKKARERKERVDKLKNDLDNLKPEVTVRKEIRSCEKDLKKILNTIGRLEQKQKKFKEKLVGPLARISEITGKLAELKERQNDLKLPQNNIPVTKKSLGRLDNLLNKGADVTFAVLTLGEKKDKVSAKVQKQAEELESLKSDYDSRVGNIERLEAELAELIAEKNQLRGELDQNVENIEQMEGKVGDFVGRYKTFDEESDCLSQADLESRIEALRSEQESTDAELTELEEEFVDLSQQEKDIRSATTKVELEIDKDRRKMEALKAEEEVMKERYGEDFSLKPVAMEQWAEDFEIERSYWKAEFYPDREVVEGFVGRYFAVQLKDAEKSLKMLFGPGEYYMDKNKFREIYGATLGSFVKETLHYLEDGQEGQVKIFIQGSADISGSRTFSGKLDDRFFYDKITVLPQKDSPESFLGEAVVKEIPATNFR
ncbi:MAG: hypothetical protein AAFP92_29815, partial [Bacteroidota bacterium]